MAGSRSSTKGTSAWLASTTLRSSRGRGCRRHAPYEAQALESGYLFDVRIDYASGAQTTRFLAEGRDASATIDSLNGGFGKNEGGDEITGIHKSDGDAGVNPRRKIPDVGRDGWRWFFTQQHDDNVTWEVWLAGPGQDSE